MPDMTNTALSRVLSLEVLASMAMALFIGGGAWMSVVGKVEATDEKVESQEIKLEKLEETTHKIEVDISKIQVDQSYLIAEQEKQSNKLEEILKVLIRQGQ